MAAVNAPASTSKSCIDAETLPVVAEVAGVIRKARLPVICALDDVLGDAGEIKAGQADHSWLQRKDRSEVGDAIHGEARVSA